MPRFDILKESPVKHTGRAQQMEALFDVPLSDKTHFRITGELPIEGQEWKIGLLVGPSGSGKSSILSSCFSNPLSLSWHSNSVLDDFALHLSMEQISSACQAVGFNTIPSWLRPFEVLSTGEKFRVTLARTLLESETNPITIDEFTSVVDRQVAKIASYAVAKYIRRENQSKKLVVASCHHDIVNWLNPDWVFDTGTNSFIWRSLQKRPPVNIVISKICYDAWRIFAPFHYMSKELNHAARCYGLWADGELAAFCGVLYRPHPRVNDIMGVSRIVTLPDFQGLGLAMVLLDNLGSCYRSLGKRFHNYPAHPSFIRTHMKSSNWRLVKPIGTFSPRRGKTSTVTGFGGRPCAVFEYIGPELDRGRDAARNLIG